MGELRGKRELMLAGGDGGMVWAVMVALRCRQQREMAMQGGGSRDEGSDAWAGRVSVRVRSESSKDVRVEVCV